MKLRRIIFTLSVLMIFTQSFWARELKLEEFRLLPHDISARTDMREDYNGDKCALIKISLPIDGCRFEGGVIAYVYDVNEYRVHVAPGTKRIRVRCPGFETLEVDFAECSDISSLESLATYSLRIGGYEAMVGMEGRDPGVNYLIMYIDPTDVPGLTVTVDGKLRQVEDGEVALCLPYGEYDYKVEAIGYRPVAGKVSVSKGEKGTIGISLQPSSDHSDMTSSSFSTDGLRPEDANLAILNIHSESKDARISLNQRERGRGHWSGRLAPGSYILEVAMEGRRTHSDVITLASGEKRELSVPELIPIFGTIDVSYHPSGASIMLDGVLVGETPDIINNVPVGYHSVTIAKKGYNMQMWSDVLVKESEVYKLTGVLEKTSDKLPADDYSPASYQGGQEAMWRFMQDKLKIPAGTLSGTHKIPVELIIDDKGRIERIDFTDSKNEIRELEETLRKIFRKMRPFNPALRNGVPEKSVFSLTIPVIVTGDDDEEL